MRIELYMVGASLLLALVQIGLAGHFKTRQYGVGWNTGARDETLPPLDRLAGRLVRAQANLFETLPLFAAAVIIAHVSGNEGDLTLWGCWMYLLARIVYVPLYAAGIPFVRSLVWLVSLVGLVMVLAAVLTG